MPGLGKPVVRHTHTHAHTDTHTDTHTYTITATLRVKWQWGQRCLDIEVRVGSRVPHRAV